MAAARAIFGEQSLPQGSLRPMATISSLPTHWPASISELPEPATAAIPLPTPSDPYPPPSPPYPIAPIRAARLPPAGAMHCAKDQEACDFSGIKEVWYGAGKRWKVAAVSVG